MMIFVHELGLATAVGRTRMEVILPPFIEAAISVSPNSTTSEFRQPKGFSAFIYVLHICRVLDWIIAS